ncbi:probable nucleoredoxin 1 [Pistacia vera]|uniref:probable nucleoredoxin 1 n=1 Tax=Pistacia vera TaxID=55513 RepID=UPI001262F1A9|nr:probable nucleoredoxin 1 [Pistacia vera]
MPWLAIPHSNETARHGLKSLYSVQETPHLIILSKEGDLVSSIGHFLVAEFGSLAYPFTKHRIKELKDEEEAQKKNQTLRTILATPSRDFVISNEGKEVAISELEGKMVGLYMYLGSHRSCKNFTPTLIDFYKSLKEKGESFEIVFVSLDDGDKESYEKEFMKMPWLAIPFGDNALKKLPKYLELRSLPTLLILGPDGKTLNLNVRDYVAEFGVQAYPFSPQKLSQLDELNKARSESQTLQSLLVSDELDFVLDKSGMKVPVSELVGKTVLLYFSRLHCPPCRAFTPKLAKTYHEIKSKHPDFEVVFVSLDFNEESFKEYYSEMPWLALPYDDKRETLLKLTFKYRSLLPHLAAIGPNGKTLTDEARELVVFFGSDAYPFTEERKKEMDRKLEKMAKGWPEKVRSRKHEHHEIVLSQRGICKCGGCNELAVGWVFGCDECDFYLHPECAMEQENGDGIGSCDGDEVWKCEGEVCYKA